jgi:hypothetical protein
MLQSCHEQTLDLGGSPAVTKRLWEMADLVEMLEAWEESGRVRRLSDQYLATTGALPKSNW